MKHGKAFRQALGQFDREQLYSPAEAIRLLKSFETAKFDETVEVHFRLGSTSAMPSSSSGARSCSRTGPGKM